MSVESAPCQSARTLWCETSAGKIRCLLTEGDSVPIVALPGSAGRAEHMLSDGIAGPVLALDWPGSGESTAATPRCTTTGLAAVVGEVIDSFGWPEVVVVGHSLGAMVAQHLASHPRVLSITLVAPSPGVLPCLRAGVWPHPLRTIVALVLCALTLCNVFRLHAKSQSDLNHAWLENGCESGSLRGERLAATLRRFEPRRGAPGGALVWLQRRLGDVAAVLAVASHRMPRLGGRRVVLVWGERDRLVAPRACRLTADLLEGEAGVCAFVGPESGHFVHCDKPELLSEAVAKARSK